MASHYGSAARNWCWLFACFAPWPRAVSIDGQSHKASDEDLERVFNDPNCERTRGSQVLDWDDIRLKLHSLPYPASLPTVKKIVVQLQDGVDLDGQVGICPFGVVAILFFFVKFLVEEPEPRIEMVRTFFSMLDGYASGMHPHLLDASDWLVKDARIAALRRALLQRLRAMKLPEAGWALESSLEKRPSSSLPPPALLRLSLPSPPEVRPLIFVYGSEVREVRQLSQGASFCGKGQWGMEVHIHEWLLASPYLTRDPAQADFFFVPAYSICMFESGFFPLLELDAEYRRLVAGLPYFQASGGRDHIFTFGSGMSANAFLSWREVIPESIFLTPETWLFNDFAQISEPCFDTWKDVAIPGFLHRHEVLSLAGSAREFADREHLALFLGRTDASRGPHPKTNETDVRGALRQLHIEGKILVAQHLSFPEMHAAMGNSKFCFVPKGKSAWSLRLYEALFAGCVPIVLSDHWELPFEDFLDVPSFVIKWPMARVGDELLDHLRRFSNSLLEEYQAAARLQRCWYVYPPLMQEVHLDRGSDELRRVCPELDSQNAFLGIVRALHRKRRVSRTSGRFFGLQ